MGLLRQGLTPIILGAIPGIALAALCGRGLETLVEGAASVGEVGHAGAVVFLATIAAMGNWSATRPVARLDIAEILRSE